MAQAIERAFARATVVVMAAAVADYRPRAPRSRKMKKSAATLGLELQRTTDILAGLGARKGRRVVVGFAAETHDVVAEARRKLAAKRLDLIVANDVTAPGAAFGSDTNVVRLIDAEGLDEALPILAKDDVADRILDWIAARRRTAAGDARATRLPARARGARRRSPRSSRRGA
jgi:phosphopantothenoylcysteine decarboxylase/phosphopantothenate--cysteine ligase